MPTSGRTLLRSEVPMPITAAACRHHSPFPASAQLSKTKQAVIVRVHCFKRRAMAQACLAAQDTLTIASKLRGLPSPVIIHVLIDEKPPNSSPSPVIIHVFIDEKLPNSRPYPVIIHVHIDENPPSSSLSCYHR
jgi:phenylpyruvate tautomerase PptA (4-oxalocrotonate tautomerase family)